MTPEMFEKLYLASESGQRQPATDVCQPNTRVSDYYLCMTGLVSDIFSLRAIAGFLPALTPFSCVLLGWQGAGGQTATMFISHTSTSFQARL
jgi:hypothetical protein